MAEGAMIRAALYIRVSTEEQAEHGVSIAAQRERLMAYCRVQGWDVAEVYIDDGYSGKDLDRPAMQRLIADAGRRLFDLVLVYKLDRLSRRQKDVLHLLEDVFEPAGVGFRSATESFDTTSAFGKAGLGMMAVFAQLERETIIERTRMGKRQAAIQGRWKGGPVTYGYRYDPDRKQLEISEPEAGTVRDIFRWYADEGLGQQAIADRLNALGRPSPRNGQRWNQPTIRYILGNPAYIGLSRHRRDLYPGHPAIISRDLWERARRLAGRRKAEHWRRPQGGGLCSGMIWCSECGARMRTKRQWLNWPDRPPAMRLYYLCYSYDKRCPYMVRDPNCPNRHYWPVEKIDGQVEQALLRYSLDETLIRQVVEEELAAALRDDPGQRLARLRGELAAVDRRLERWYDAFERGAIDPSELERRVRHLQARRRELEAQIAREETALREQESKRIDAEEVIARVRDLPGIWRMATEQERRTILAGLVRRVLVDAQGRVTLEFI